MLFNFGKDLQQNRADLKQSQTEMRDLSAATQAKVRELQEAIQHLAYQIQLMQQNEAHEREKMALRFEIETLRAQKQLPPANPDTTSENRN